MGLNDTAFVRSFQIHSEKLWHLLATRLAVTGSKSAVRNLREQLTVYLFSKADEWHVQLEQLGKADVDAH